MNFQFSHDFDTDARTYWGIFWSEDYNRELYRQLNMRSRQVLEQTDLGHTIHRSQRLEPPAAIPSWAAKTLRDISYVEHDIYHRDASRMEVRIEPTLATVTKDRFQMFGVHQVIDLPGPVADPLPGANPLPSEDRRCRRDFTGEVHISVPLLGSKIERMMIDHVKEAYETAAQVTRDFILRLGTRLKAQPKS